MSLRLSIVKRIGGLLVLAAVTLPGLAQSLPETPHMPELLGIYPGMPQAAARAQLQKHSSATQVTPAGDPLVGFGMTTSEPSGIDMVSVMLTRAPNDPAVWMIQRVQNFNQKNPMSQAALIGALREKYGKETMANDKAGGGLWLYWIFDASGHLLPAADRGLAECKGVMLQNYIGQGPPQGTNPSEQACFRGFFGVTANLNRLDAQLLQAYTVELVNMPYAIRAAAVTGNANNAAADSARKDLEKKADTNKPKF